MGDSKNKIKEESKEERKGGREIGRKEGRERQREGRRKAPEANKHSLSGLSVQMIQVTELKLDLEHFQVISPLRN